jgi:hypothetical protein
MEPMLGAFLIVLGYLYCYGLSAVLVRVYLLSGQVKTGLTWIIVMLLVGVGSSVPAVIAYVLFQDQSYQGTDGMWWKLPNPFMAVYECWPTWDGRVDMDYLVSTYWFLAVWSVLVTLACLPWFAGQVRRFHPPQKAVIPLAELVEPAAPAPAEAVVPAVNGAVAAPAEARPTQEVLPG